MSTYRQIRRQTRRARRAGLQPIVVIDSPLPVPVGVLLARLAWRYRSEIAPATTAGAVLAAGWWLHHGHAGLVAVAARRLRPGRSSRSPYSARGSAWPGSPNGSTRPPPCSRPADGSRPPRCSARSPRRCRKSSALGAFLLAVPWWAHRRRRARARVQRALAAWPDISKAIGLPGSKIQSATVDLWGWRARVKLARGQTIADVTARIPADRIGTRHLPRRGPRLPDRRRQGEQVRTASAGHRPARRGDPRGQDRPHGPSPSPIDLGPFEDAEQCRVSFLRRHALFAGTTGSGKSGGLNVLMATLAACDDVVIWAIDLKNGMELQPWAPCIDRLATTPRQAAALLADAVAILQARAAHLASTGRRVWEPSPDMPALVIIIDEYAELADEAPAAMSDTDSIARLGRAVAVTLVAATQRPTQKAMGQGAVRSQMDTRICFRVRERQRRRPGPRPGHAHRGMARPHAQRPRQVPRLRTPSTPRPKRARAYLVTDDDVARVAAHFGRQPAAARRPVARRARPRPRPPSPSRGTWSTPSATLASPTTPRTITTPPPSKTLLWGALCAAPDERGRRRRTHADDRAGPVHGLPATSPSSPSRAAPSRSAGAAGARPAQERR